MTLLPTVCSSTIQNSVSVYIYVSTPTHCIICVSEMHYILIHIIIMFSLVNSIVTDDEYARLQERLLQTERMMERIVSEKKRVSGR